jgi:thiol-disulfide isomerase/thioredoxin
MNKKHVMVSVVIILLGLFAPGFSQGINNLKNNEFFIETPQKHARPGEKVTVNFKTDLKGITKFEFQIVRMDMSFKLFHLIPVRNNDIYSVTFPVPADAITVTVLVQGLTNCYNGGYPMQNIILYNNDDKPVRGARTLGIDYPDSILNEELKDYPDYIMGYSGRIAFLSFQQKYPEIRSILNQVEKKYSKNPDLFALLSFGYSKVNSMDTSLYYYKKYLSSDNPRYAPYILSNIQYSFLDKKETIDSILLERTALQYPESDIAEQYLYKTLNDQNADHSHVVKIIEASVSAKPENYYFYALYCLNILKDTAGAFNYALKYQKNADDGLIDIYGLLESHKAPEIFKISSEFYHAKGDNNMAFTDALIAYGLNMNKSYKGDYALNVAKIAFSGGNQDTTKKYLLISIANGLFDEALPWIKKSYQIGENKTFFKSLYRQSAVYCDSVPNLSIKLSANDSIVTGRGDLLALDFWSPGCKPCIVEIPILNELAESLKGKDCIFIAANLAPMKYSLNFSSKFQGWNVIESSRQMNASFLKISAIPQFFIVDGKGKIRFYHLGALDFKAVEKIKRVIEAHENYGS